MRKILLLVLFFSVFAMSASAQNHELTIDLRHNGAPVQKTMYGLFIEDVNFAADGGLYAELIKNRSFDFPYPFTGWKFAGNVEIKNGGPFERNPNYIRLHASDHPHKWTAIVNEGFFGIGVEKNKEYRFTFYARVPEGKETAHIRVELADSSSPASDQDFVAHEMVINGREWRQYEVVLKSPVSVSKSQLRIFLLGGNTVDMEHISLFPVDTWKGRRGGLRKDLMEALAELKPGCFRFPGGCIIEGTDLDTRYNWKNTLGPVENRPLNENRWHYTFRNRFYPDYFQTYGLGFYEYFLLSEDIGAEPLPVVNVGLACQFQNNDEHAHMPVDSLEQYIQDAVDLIEFANGDTTTVYGRIRAHMGHPEPFGLKFLAIGNEQWGDEYIVRLEKFVERLRKEHPEISIIGSSGPNSEGPQFDHLWSGMKRLKVDLVDEHFYRSEDWFHTQGSRYDSYDRTGPKVFVGEYACHGDSRKWNHFNASLYEAAFMTGLERNADVVHMATYAPLFAHIEGWNWRPDLIWYDNLRSVRSCSYYVQQMYSCNPGTHVLKTTAEDGSPLAGYKNQDGLFASAVWDADKHEVILKIVNVSDTDQSLKLDFVGLKKNQKMLPVDITTYRSNNLYEDNTLENPMSILPYVKTAGDSVPEEVNLTSRTFMMYRFKVSGRR